MLSACSSDNEYNFPKNNNKLMISLIVWKEITDLFFFSRYFPGINNP